MNKTIGWIGTGLMGSPMAHHLVKAGYDLIVFNRTPSKATTLMEAGCKWANSPAEVAEKCSIIFTIIGFPKDVEEVYFGTNGILSTVKPNAVLIDMTTTRPSLAISIAEAAVLKQCSFIDAPVSGGELGAINATLSVMIGGDKETVDYIMPLFKVFSANRVHQGKVGNGQHTKMCNQITIAGTMIGVCESLIYGFKAGLDLNTMLQSISKGAAGCWTLDVLAPKVVNNDFAPGFLVEHFIKDLGIALDEAKAMQLALPGLALGHQLYLSTEALGNGREGTQALYRALSKMSNL